jgi:conjugal transfer/entry exclusion protein
MAQIENQVAQLQKQVEDLTKLNAEFIEQQKVVMSSVQSLLETPVAMSKQEPARELRSFEKHLAEQKRRNDLLKSL